MPRSNNNTGGTKQPPWPVKVDYLIILAFGALLISMAPFSAMVYDTARSLSAAHDIANADRFPLQGPVLAGVIHFGPIWYYFLCIPMLFGFGVIGVTVWCKLWYAVTALAAYRLGWAMPGYTGSKRAFGLCLVGLLGGLGWHSMTTTIMAHTMYQWLCVLVSILCLHTAVKQPSSRAYTGSGLMFSLALHAHPSAIVLAPFYVYLAIAYGIEKSKVYAAAGLFLAGALVPFTPYLISQAYAGWPDWESAIGFMQNNLSASDNSSLLSMLESIFIKGPLYAAEQFTLINPPLLAVWQVLLFSLAAVLLFRITGFRHGILLLALILLMTVMLIKIKTVTHYYMTFSHWLVISIMAAYAVSQIRHATIITALLIGVAIGIQAMVLYRVANMGDVGFSEKPADLLADIDGDKPLKYYRYPYMDNLTRTRVARYICDQGYSHIQFGGSLGLQVELSGGMEYELECGQRAPAIFLFGLQAEQTLIGLTGAQVKAKGGCNGMQILNICLEQPAAWQQTEGISLAIADPSVYPPRQKIKPGHKPQERMFELSVRQGEVLVFSNPLIAWMPWEIIAHDNLLEIVYQDEALVMFRAASTDDMAQIIYRANRPDYIQISKLDRQPTQEPGRDKEYF